MQKNGWAFTEYYIDNYGIKRLSPDQRRECVEGQQKVDKLAEAEAKRGRIETVKAQVASLEEQIRLLQESLRVKRQELDGK